MKRVITEFFFLVSILFLYILFTVQFDWGYPLLHIHWIILGASMWVMIRPERAVWVTFVGAILLESQSALPFGVLSIPLFAGCAVMLLSSQKLFKRFALHSIVMNGCVMIIIYSVTCMIILALAQLFELIETLDFSLLTILSSMGWQILTHSILLSIAYTIIQFIRTTFLKTDQYA